MKGHGYPDCKSTEEESSALHAQWEGNTRQRTNTTPHTSQTTESLNTASPPCTHTSPSILAAVMSLIACCTQPKTLEQPSGKEPEAQGNLKMEMSGSHEDGTGTTLQWCASISNEPMSGDNQDTKRTSKVHSEPMHHRNKEERNHSINESTGKIEEQAGILSSATTGSTTPHSESPSETESHGTR